MRDNSLIDGLAPRLVAFEALLEWKRKGGYLQESLQNLVGALEDRDRGLAWELSFGVCRNYRRLQNAIYTWASAEKPKLNLELVLAIGLYQIFFLQRVPQHAAVHVTVSLARKVSGEGAAKMTNAILQRAIREGLPKLSSDPVQAMGVEFSMPDWLVAKWLRQAGGDAALVRTRLTSAREIPGQWVRVNLQRTTLAEFQEKMSLNEARTWGDRWIDVGPKVGALVRTDAFAKGLFSIQNPASDLLVQLLGAQSGERVWDACAAPGGKSALMLERTPGVKLVVTDLDERRILSLDDVTTRLGLHLTEIKTCDAAKPSFGCEFQRILLDVPCSNLGVMARRPEVPLRLDRKSFEAVAARQKAILDGASACLLPGGVIVYGTCSPEPEETVQVIEAFLKAHPDFELEDASKFIDVKWVRDGYVQAYDAELGFDGFFGARLRRKS